MSAIKKYTTKKGETRYKFKVYLGMDKVTGKRVETSRQGFKKKRDAERAYQQLKIDFANGEYGKNKNVITFDELFNDWFNSIYKKDVSENTALSLMNAYNYRLKSEIGSVKLDKLNSFYLQKIINTLPTASKSTFSLYYKVLRLPLKYAFKIGLIEQDIIERIVLPKFKSTSKQENFLTKEELQETLAAAKKFDTRIYTVFRILAFTGMRGGELFALTWDDIDLDNGIINVSKTTSYNIETNTIVVKSPKTKTSNRTISIDPTTVQAIKDWKKIRMEQLLKTGIRENKEYLFVNSLNKLEVTGKFYVNSFYAENPQLKKISLHGFRHTHATLLLEAGASVKEIQTRLGHSNVATTLNVYTAVTEKQEKTITEKLSNFVGF